jgi:hypothetical protein
MGADRTLMQVKVRCGLGRVGVLGRLYGNSRGMSVLGQNRKSSMRAHVFRFALKSGHCATESACPFRAANNGSGASLFKDLIRAGEKGRRDFDAKRFRGLEINSKQVLGGLFNG